MTVDLACAQTLYFYPPPYKLETKTLPSPQTISVEQITTQFPSIAQMSGVVLLVYWSTLCPTDVCDYSLIDQTLNYWREKGKQVVLAVATIGYPIFSAVRIATGLMAEDNPRIGPLGSLVNGFREQDWLAYCIAVTELYGQSFSRSTLEFDIGRLSWFYARGDAQAKQEVGEFIDLLLAHEVLLAFDGLDSDSADLAKFERVGSGISVSLSLLRRYRDRGGKIGLEAIGHLSSPKMHNIAKISEAIAHLRPDRLVFFSDVPQAVLRQDKGRVSELLQSIGYNDKR